jgi:predicted DCC family thiol-disulfide oxidoreductase YuxK
MSELPTLADRPGGHVVIFDGQCKFCLSQVTRLARLDVRKSLAFVSLHDPVVAERYPDLSHEQLMEQMYVVARGTGGRHGGVDAFRFLTRKMPLLWPLAPLLHIPFSLPLWRWGYRQVAMRRYRWGKVGSACENDACQIHFLTPSAKRKAIEHNQHAGGK